jgi:hypothetical protein
MISSPHRSCRGNRILPASMLSYDRNQIGMLGPKPTRIEQGANKKVWIRGNHICCTDNDKGAIVTANQTKSAAHRPFVKKTLFSLIGPRSLTACRAYEAVHLLEN